MSNGSVSVWGTKAKLTEKCRERRWNYKKKFFFLIWTIINIKILVIPRILISQKRREGNRVEGFYGKSYVNKSSRLYIPHIAFLITFSRNYCRSVWSIPRIVAELTVCLIKTSLIAVAEGTERQMTSFLGQSSWNTRTMYRRSHRFLYVNLFKLNSISK